MTTNVPDYLWFNFRAKIMAGLYEENKLTLEEIGDIFKISRERVRQIITNLVKMRSTSPTKRSYNRERKFAQRLVDMGFNVEEAIKIVGHSSLKIQARGNIHYPGGLSHFINSRRWVQAIWYEIQNIVIQEAWSQGATTQELADLFHTNTNVISVRINRLRKQGYNIPYRYSINDKGIRISNEDKS